MLHLHAHTMPGDLCTTRQVDTCSSEKTACVGLKPDEVDRRFHELYKGAYAQVCEESDGKLCMYTDIVYEPCGEDKGTELVS